MSLVSSVFAKKRVRFEALLPFGFVREDEEFSYRRLFMDGDFEARVQVSTTGQVTGQVWDCELDEAYEAIYRENQLGPFVSQVKEDYLSILHDIAQACFDTQPFQHEQTNRLALYLEQTYGDTYDHPFAKYPDYLSYRVAGKWYALVFPTKLAKLGVTGQEAEREVEVVNLKVPAQKLPTYLEKEGIYPAYHMSKKSWVSVVLDGNLADEDLFDLLDQSRQLVQPKSLAQAAGPDFWVIPANPKYYDIDSEFATSPVIDWTQKAKIRTGDYVTIYMTAPIRAIRYLCRVLQADLPNQGQRDREDIKKLMRLELLKTYPDEQFNQAVLLEKGLKTVRGPRRLPQGLVDLIKSDVAGKE